MSDYEVRKKHIEPLWDRIDRNRIELALFVLLFLVSSAIGLDLVLGISLMGLFFIGDSPVWWTTIWENIGRIFFISTLVALVGAGTYVAWALTRSEKWLLGRVGAELAPLGEFLPTKYALKDMAIASGYDVAPALYVMDTNNVNAFIFGHSQRRAVVGVTVGFVERLEIDEQRAAFANLMARLSAGDTMWATGVTALMRPMWAVRDRGLRDAGEDTRMLAELGGAKDDQDIRHMNTSGSEEGIALFVWFLLVAWVFVIVSELILSGHRSSHLKHSETADAEGMLLLKDPKPMLSAIEKCVRFNNFVPGAGPGYTLLFYCYTGDDTDDENDPEMRRVARLREVLGAEGMAPPPVFSNEARLEPPSAPRIVYAEAGPADALPEWSVIVENSPRSSIWKWIGTVGVMLAIAGALTWFGMVFDASLPRAVTGEYDTVPIGAVFVIFYRVFALLCIAVPMTAGILDRRVQVGIGAGVVSAAIWLLFGAVGIAGYAHYPVALTAGVAVTAGLGGLLGVAIGRVVGRAGGER